MAWHFYHCENLEKTIPTKISAVLDTYALIDLPMGMASWQVQKNIGAMPRSLAARELFVQIDTQIYASKTF